MSVRLFNLWKGLNTGDGFADLIDPDAILVVGQVGAQQHAGLIGIGGELTEVVEYGHWISVLRQQRRDHRHFGVVRFGRHSQLQVIIGFDVIHAVKLIGAASGVPHLC